MVLLSHDNVKITTREQLADELKELPVMVIIREKDLFETAITVILSSPLENVNK